MRLREFAKLDEIKKGAKDSNGFSSCWTGYHASGTKKGKNGGQVRNCVKNEGWQDTIVQAGQTARRAVDTTINSIPRPFDEREVAKDLNRNKGTADKQTREGAGAQQAAIAIAKKASGKYTKDGKRLKEGSRSS